MKMYVILHVFKDNESFFLLKQYTKHISLVGHQNSVTTVAGYQQSSNGDIYVASGSADSTVKIWHIHDTTGI